MKKSHIEVKHLKTSGLNLNKDIIKFGVTTTLRDNAKSYGELIELDVRDPLSKAIQGCCVRWRFINPDIYALQFSEKPYHYVTEASKKKMNGKLVTMTYSPTKVCSDIVEKLGDKGHMLVGLKELALKASDPTIAEVFVNEDGISILLELIEKGKLGESEAAYQYTFQSLLHIMLNSSSVLWDRIQGPVLSGVLHYINSPKGPTEDRLGLKYCLQVLENTVSSGFGYEQIEKELILPSLITLLESQDNDVQQNVISFINALLTKAEPSRRKQLASNLNSRQYRMMILNNVINRPGERSEIVYQLYVLQTLLLNIYNERRLTPVDPLDHRITLKIADLCRIAFNTDGDDAFSGRSNRQSAKKAYSTEYRKLGFQNEVYPVQDFILTPPGVLALDCMSYLAQIHTETYKMVVADCAYRRGGTGNDILLPFASASITLTNVLCDLLGIGEPPREQQGKFYPFFFQHDKSFEEIFCKCIQLVIKTWKEMGATIEDFDKVFVVVREQIKRALDPTLQTYAEFVDKLNILTFAEVTRLKTQERSNREEEKLQTKPLQDLRKQLMPDIISLIRQNRMHYLISGTRFKRFELKGLSVSVTTLVGTQRPNEKFWYCRLSPNEKTIHYGDCGEKESPKPDALSQKLNVKDLKGLLIGKDCPHVKESRRNRNNKLAFSVIKDTEPLDTLDFIAPDQITFDLWTDGINTLLGKEMVSQEAQKDLDFWLHMEIKLRLLDLEGIEIPDEAPPIPPPPPNYNFACYASPK